MKEFYVYLLASKYNGTLYLGMTSDLPRRGYEHKNGLADGFTKKYGVHILVWYQGPGDFESVAKREKQLKKWNRLWKIRLIEQDNPEWKDLYDSLV